VLTGLAQTLSAPARRPADAAWCDEGMTAPVPDEQNLPVPAPAELEQLAVTLASGAAEVIRGARAEQLEVSSKTTATDLVTQVDRRAERWLAEHIEAARPGDGVVGEEGTGLAATSPVRWYVDPIDGTVNFVLGLPQYAVSVAAEVDGLVVAGAVCNVALGEMFHASLGGGAWLGDRRLRGPRGVPLARSVVGTGFGYEAERRERQAAVLARLLPLVGDVRRLGSAALDLCSVAAGRLDAYFEAGLHAWDYAAGALIAAEAGCVLSGLRGRPPGTTLTAAAGPGVAAEFFAMLERFGADSVST
jgi:myo-inositol-1(or 4)-monophosphatase